MNVDRQALAATARQAVIDDDMSQFSRIAMMFGRAQAEVVDRDRWLRSAAHHLLERAQQVPVNA